MRKYSAADDVTSLDYHAAIVDDQGFLKDKQVKTLAPKPKGYDIIPAVPERAITSAVKKK